MGNLPSRRLIRPKGAAWITFHIVFGSTTAITSQRSTLTTHTALKMKDAMRTAALSLALCLLLVQVASAQSECPTSQ